ncbi:hypothetical protein ACFPPD_19110 [Cohnella suwonensis]|uniref:Uncharacterized protein n=1 Tax=Cohnella suwonensis TaxID=696072 RepID=A0ABW0M0X6_9BACL
MDRKEAEELLARSLSGEQPDASREDASEEAVKRLRPRWEIRVQAELDPVVEETKAYRSMAEEVDGRYDGVPVPAKKDE